MGKTKGMSEDVVEVKQGERSIGESSEKGSEQYLTGDQESHLKIVSNNLEKDGIHPEMFENKIDDKQHLTERMEDFKRRDGIMEFREWDDEPSNFSPVGDEPTPFGMGETDLFHSHQNNDDSDLDAAIQASLMMSGISPEEIAFN